MIGHDDVIVTSLFCNKHLKMTSSDVTWRHDIIITSNLVEMFLLLISHFCLNMKSFGQLLTKLWLFTFLFPWKSHFWPISTKKYEIGQNIRVNGYKCFIFVPQLTTKKTNISWNFGENSTRWRHFIALCLHAISMGGVVPAFWGTHRDIKKRHWKKNCPSFFLSRKMSHVSVRISFSVFLLDQNR